MNLLPGVSLLRIIAYAMIVLGLMATGARLEHNRMQKKLDAAVAAHNQFKGGVEALGREAAARAEKQRQIDLKAKEQADEANRRSLAAARATISRLRAAAAQRDSRGGSMSAAPAGSRCPDGQVCFDRAEYQRALGDFDRDARQLADEGTKIGNDLDTAVRWANRRSAP